MRWHTAGRDKTVKLWSTDRWERFQELEGSAGTVLALAFSPDGRKLITMRPLGKVTVEKPWESLHNILNGQPGRRMPSLRTLEAERLAGLLAYSQTLLRAK